MKNLILLLFVLFLTNNCTSKIDHEANLNSWIGAKENTLIEQWGTPSSFYKAEDGKKYLTWKNSSQTLVGGYAPRSYVDYFGNVTTYGGSPGYLVTSNCDITMVLIKGVVSSWSYKGNNCYDY